MKHMKLFRALGEIDPKYVDEATRHSVSKRVWMPVAAAAACVALAVGLWQGGVFAPTEIPVEVPNEGTTTEATDPTDTDVVTDPTDTTTKEPDADTTTDGTADTTTDTKQPDQTETKNPTDTDKTDPTKTEKPTPSVTGGTDKTEPTKNTTATDKTDPTKTEKPTPSVTGGTDKTEPTKTTSTVAITLPTAIGGQPIKEMGLNKVSTFCEMTIDELEKHYGQKLIPTWLPEGMEKRLDMPLGVYKKDLKLINENKSIWKNLLDTEVARDADVVYDCNRIRWSDFIDGRRELTVGICTAPYPRYKLGDITRFDDPVTVGNTEVMAAYFEDSADCWCWSTLFRKDNVEYYVEGWNITKEEFVHILESLV